MKTSESSSILLRNLGFSESFFEKLDSEQTIYLLKKEKLRKVCSENAVLRIEKNEMVEGKSREAEDMELYHEVEDCGFFSEEEDTLNKGGLIRNANYINRDSNFYEQIDHFAQASRINKKSEIYQNLQPTPSDSNFYNKTLESDLKIFKNCSQSQMNQLNQIFSEMNSSKEEKILVKAYKSKLKFKFYQIYEKNSQNFKETVKYKIFHKCNYPSCGRTFASSGWLRSHFKDHLKELKKNKFNIIFENFVEKLKNSTI